MASIYIKSNVLMRFILIGAFISTMACAPPSTQMDKELASDWAFPFFEKVDSLNPILLPSQSLGFIDPILNKSIEWEGRNVLNPTAVVRDGKVHLLYRAQDKTGTSRIGMAISDDGMHFKKMAEPIFYPANDEVKALEWNYKKLDPKHIMDLDCATCYFDGVEDPRIVESKDGRYIMTYTAYDGKTARLALASSDDLTNWTKHGLVLSDEKYRDTWSKAGAIVGKRVDDRIVAHRIDGLYWMYFGDTNLFMATSEDLINWKVLEDEESMKMISVLHPRKGYFDSRLVEPGPYALMEDDGIVLIYNSSNAANFNDPSLPKFTYAAGQALFHKEKPYQLIDRSQSYFIKPDKDYERVGEVNEVCFVEGLVFFQGRWLLYYGTADSKIAMAIYEPNS